MTLHQRLFAASNAVHTIEDHRLPAPKPRGRTVPFKGDQHDSTCPNCDHAFRFVILVHRDVMLVKCPACSHTETIARE